MGPPRFDFAFRAIVIVCILVGVALGFAVPWLWDVAIRPLLRIGGM